LNPKSEIKMAMKKIIAVLTLLLTGHLAGLADAPSPRDLARQLINDFNSNPTATPNPATVATNITVLQKAIEAEPTDPALPFALATCYLAQKNAPAAFANLERAYALSQNNPRIGMAYAMILKRNREPLKARMIFQQMVAAHPGQPPLQIALASLDLTVQNYAEASALIENILNHAPADLADNDRGALLYMLGVCHLHQGDQAGAIDLLKQANTRMPHAVLVLATLGEACLKAGDLNGAKNNLDQALAINGRYPAALYYKGVSLERQGTPDLAAPLFRAAYASGRDRLRDNGEDYYLMALVCRKLGKTAEASQYEASAARLSYASEAPWAPK
jgi:tetratricopeptide (TPR) repeat protein